MAERAVGGLAGGCSCCGPAVVFLGVSLNSILRLQTSVTQTTLPNLKRFGQVRTGLDLFFGVDFGPVLTVKVRVRTLVQDWTVASLIDSGLERTAN
jgi:hypothetical protein